MKELLHPDVLVMAELLRDDAELFPVEQVRYVDGKIEVPVGFWAWRTIRKIFTEALEKHQNDNACRSFKEMEDGSGRYICIECCKVFSDWNAAADYAKENDKTRGASCANTIGPEKNIL